MYWVIGILGLALMITSFVTGCSNNMVGLWSSFLLSAGVVIASGIIAARAQA